MPKPEQDLGRLVSTHATAPAYMQRAAIVAAVSFLFFLGTLAAFYVRRHIGYFGLSTAFLAVYLFTLVSWIMQKRNIVRVYENGIRYKKFDAAWQDLRAINSTRNGLHLSKDKRNETVIPPTVTAFDVIVRSVRQGVENGS